MNNQPADDEFRSAGQWNVGPLQAHGIGDLHIHLTAKKPGAPKVHFVVWGNSKANPTPSIPDSAREVTCECAIHP